MRAWDTRRNVLGLPLHRRHLGRALVVFGEADPVATQLGDLVAQAGAVRVCLGKRRSLANALAARFDALVAGLGHAFHRFPAGVLYPSDLRGSRV